MNANELRIGNYVDIIDRSKAIHLPCGIKAKVLTIGFGEIEWIHHNEHAHAEEVWNKNRLSDISPIALSEEWLIKFGFEEIDEDGLWQRPNNECFQIQCEYLNGTWAHIWDGAFTDAPIGYVHQLMNLYQALTNEELTLTES